MITEYFQHLLGLMPWEIFSFGNWLGFGSWMANQIDVVLWVGLLYVIPMGGLIMLTKVKRSYQY